MILLWRAPVELQQIMELKYFKSKKVTHLYQTLKIINYAKGTTQTCPPYISPKMPYYFPGQSLGPRKIVKLF